MCLTPEQLEYELNYWKLTYSKHTREKYTKYIDLWQIDVENTRLESVLEVGTGPFLGVLPYVDSRIKIGLDPNYNNFNQLGLMKKKHDVICVNGCIEDNVVCGMFDAVFMADGVEAIKKGALGVIHSLLTLRGNLFLHLHLRREDQLTPGHQEVFLYDDLEREVRRANLTLLWKQMYEEDPIPQYTNGGKYNTVIGVWTK